MPSDRWPDMTKEGLSEHWKTDQSGKRRNFNMVNMALRREVINIYKGTLRSTSSQNAFCFNQAIIMRLIAAANVDGYYIQSFSTWEKNTP